MLGKLLKYDLNWIINKVMIIYYIILVVVSIGIKIIESVDQTLFLVIVDKILVGIFIACCISTIITCFMRTWTRFIQNVYKDESYLTHTLPVTKNQILASKVIAAIISLVISLLVIIVCVAFTYLNKSTFEELRLMYQSLVDAYNGVVAFIFVTGLILLIILEAINMMMCGIFGIVVGHRSNNHKILKSEAVGLGVYFLLSTITIVVLNVISQNLLNEVVNDGFPSVNTLKIMGFTSLGLYLTYILFFYFQSRRILNKGVNVD